MDQETTNHKLKFVSFETKGMTTVKKVWLKFDDSIDIEPEDGKEDSREKYHGHWVESDHTPHQDFATAMYALAAHAINIWGFQLTSHGQKEFTVVEVKISGDLANNQARVQMALAYKCERDEKLVKLPMSPEIAVNDSGDYLTWKGLKKCLEDVEKESVLYVQGKHLDDVTPITFQLGIFDAPVKENKPASEKRRPSRKKKEETVNEELSEAPAPFSNMQYGSQSATA